jgi:hypothetical protein
MEMMIATPASQGSTFPVIVRERIAWRKLDIGLVEISIHLVNEGDSATENETLKIEAAPFGAFVPNDPIASIAVGGLEPGEERTVSAFVPLETLEKAGRGPAPFDDSFLPNSMTHFLNRAASLHWIGNLNVYFDRAPESAVERHCAFGLEVPAGSVLGALFLIGRHGCRLTTRSSDPHWTANAQVVLGSHGILEVTTPKELGRRAEVTVDVEHLASGKRVPVEFAFRTVSGMGQTIGCKRV